MIADMFLWLLEANQGKSLLNEEHQSSHSPPAQVWTHCMRTLSQVCGVSLGCH